MKHSLYTAFNLFCIVSILLFCGGIFWFWRGTIAQIQEAFVRLPPETSFREIQISPSLAIVQNDSHGVVSSTLSQDVDNIFDSEKGVSSSLAVGPPSIEPVIVKKQIPKEINLAVPFTSQAPEKNWDQPWQDACEEAALLMVDAYYREYTLSPIFSRDEMLKMVKWEEEVNAWGRSIEIEKIQKLVQYYSKKSSHIIENPTIDQIKQYVAAGTPVYVVADGKILPNPHFQHGGPAYHALVIRGYTEESFITNDPGTQFGENYLYKYTDLMNAIRDWNSGDVVHGRRVVLVIE